MKILLKLYSANPLLNTGRQKIRINAMPYSFLCRHLMLNSIMYLRFMGSVLLCELSLRAYREQ